MVFHALMFLSGPEGDVENRGQRPSFQQLQRDLANINVLGNNV